VHENAAVINFSGSSETMALFMLQQMTAAYGYVWFLPAFFTDRWWDTDRHRATSSTQNVPCTSAEMLSAIEGHFILTPGFLGEKNSQIVGNCTVENWVKAYVERLTPLVSDIRHFICIIIVINVDV